MIHNLLKSLFARNDFVGRTLNNAVTYYEAKKGPIYAQRHFKQSVARGRSVKAALAVVDQRWPDVKSKSSEKPVFILSAGWRSGSTMLQRLVMSKQSILIWGEPYSHAMMIRHLSDGLSSITLDWPEQDWFINEHDLTKLDTTFVANLYPEINELQNAYLAYMKTLFIDTAKSRGFGKWGIKDVRLTIDDARFLKWLYPEAKFLFLVRNPFDAYHSYRLDRSWYHEWPYDPVLTAKRFGQHWRDLAKGFHDERDDVGGLLLRHEDICSGNIDFTELENYLEVKIDPTLISTKVGSHRRDDDTVPSYENRMLAKEVSKVARIFGYE